MNEQEFAELSAAAALHALSPDDERRYRAALTVHPEWRRVVRSDEHTAAALAAAAEPVTPPADIRSALLAAISAESPQPKEPSQPKESTDGAGPATEEPARVSGGVADDDSPSASTAAGAPAALTSPATDATDAGAPQRRGGLRILFALAACLVLLVGIGVGATALNQYLNRPAAVVALEQIEGASDAQQSSVTLEDGGTATAHWSASLGKAVLVAEGIEAPAEGDTYELWFVRGETPIAAGTFDVDGGRATAQLHGEMKEGDAIAVTVEQEGGSPTGKPTSDPVIVIPTAA